MDGPASGMHWQCPLLVFELQPRPFNSSTKDVAEAAGFSLSPGTGGKARRRLDEWNGGRPSLLGPTRSNFNRVRLS
jgi:hypothetical protein